MSDDSGGIRSTGCPSVVVRGQGPDHEHVVEPI